MSFSAKENIKQTIELRELLLSYPESHELREVALFDDKYAKQIISKNENVAFTRENKFGRLSRSLERDNPDSAIAMACNVLAIMQPGDERVAFYSGTGIRVNSSIYGE